jgi:hypothetical protein
LVIHVTGTAAVHRAELRTRINTSLAVVAAPFDGRVRCPREEKEQCLRLPPVKRQVYNPFLVDEIGHVRGFRRKDVRVGGDADLLLDGPDLQGDRLRRGLIHNQLDSLLLVPRKSGLGDCERIGPDRQNRKEVGAVVTRDDLPGQVCVNILDGNLRLRHGGAGTVANDAAEAGGGELSKQRPMPKPKCQRQKNEQSNGIPVTCHFPPLCSSPRTAA